MPLAALTLLAAALVDGGAFPRGNVDYVVPGAGDFVAEMVVDPEIGAPDGTRVTVTRSGPWQREAFDNADASRGVRVTDSRTGRSWTYLVRAGGGYGGLTLGGAANANRVTTTRTAQAETVLGERCTVWVFTSQTITERTCLTSDGIMLWRRVLGSRGSVLSAARTVRLQRRHVPAAAVAPPSDLLELTT